MSAFSFHGKKVGCHHQTGITNFLSAKHDIHQNQRLNQIRLNNMIESQCIYTRLYLMKMREESVIQGLLDGKGHAWGNRSFIVFPH